MLIIERHIPNVLTLLNLLSGFVGLVFAGRYAFLADRPNDLALAGLMVFVGAGFDVLDGLAARLLKVKTEIGLQLDSLADVVTFGVLPAFILSALIGKTHEPWVDAFFLLGLPIGILLPMAHAACAALRLAKFNTLPDLPYFRGLPSPAAGLLLASVPLMMEHDTFIMGGAILRIGEMLLQGWLLVLLVLFTSWAMLGRFRLMAFKKVWHAPKGKALVAGFAAVAAILGVFLLWAAVPVLILLYIIASVIYFSRTPHEV